MGQLSELRSKIQSLTFLRPRVHPVPAQWVKMFRGRCSQRSGVVVITLYFVLSLSVMTGTFDHDDQWECPQNDEQFAVENHHFEWNKSAINDYFQ